MNEIAKDCASMQVAKITHYIQEFRVLLMKGWCRMKQVFPNYASCIAGMANSILKKFGLETSQG